LSVQFGRCAGSYPQDRAEGGGRPERAATVSASGTPMGDEVRDGVRTPVATTAAQAAVMRQTADKFDQANQSLQTMLRSLLGELEVLRTQWQGAGGSSFEQVKQAWAEDQQALQQALGETATA